MITLGEIFVEVNKEDIVKGPDVTPYFPNKQRQHPAQLFYGLGEGKGRPLCASGALIPMADRLVCDQNQGERRNGFSQ